ncbi:MAG TPA: hypothetical protein VIY86_12600, partial [Pirellulaceae bacterium]
SGLGGDEDTSHRFEGSTSDWRDVMDALRSASLFGDHVPVVRVEDADSFISQHREPLEKYLEQPSSGRLILQPKSWLKTTRLHKRLIEVGLIIDCSLPERKFGGGGAVDRKALVTWLTTRAKQVHGLAIEPSTVEFLVELAGEAPGVVDQEFQKLAVYVSHGERVVKRHIEEIGCGWNLRTTWELLDAVLAGNAPEALLQLHRLLQGGEEPIAVYGAFSWSLRRFATASQWSDWQARAQGSRDLPEALRRAGFRSDYKSNGPATAERQLRQIGWGRCQDLFRRLLQLDLRMKLSHSASGDARRLLEESIVELSSATRATGK